MSIANSNFEEWSIAHKSFDLNEFPFSLKKMSLDGALFDEGKLNYFSKEVIAKMPLDELFQAVKDYADAHDEEFAKRISESPEYVKKILNIEKDRKNPRKDYAKYSDIYPLIKFFFHDEWESKLAEGLSFPSRYKPSDIKSLLLDLRGNMAFGADESTWWNGVKEIASAHGFASSNKDYKANPDAYLGSVSDGAELLRIAITTASQSPNLHEILEILGSEEVKLRLEKVCQSLN